MSTENTAATGTGAGTGLVTITPSNAGGMLAVLHGAGGANLDVPKPFAQPILLIDDTRIAGTTHVEDIDELAESLHEGDRLTLERDSENRYDRWAVRVLNGQGRRMGFLAADANEIPARLMDGGKKLFAKVASVELKGSWWKVGIEVWLDD